MSKTLYIMQGIPGSGKSTIAKRIASQETGETRILSTDDFWGKDYNFDLAKLGIAHHWNQIRTAMAMDFEIPCLIIDNTNIKKPAVQPYRDMAEKYGYDVVIVSVKVDPELAISRQKNREGKRVVPEEVIRKMANEMEEL